MNSAGECVSNMCESCVEGVDRPALAKCMREDRIAGIGIPDKICKGSCSGNGHPVSNEMCESSCSGNRHPDSNEMCKSSCNGNRHPDSNERGESSCSGNRHPDSNKRFV